jgi:hypothetical protein
MPSSLCLDLFFSINCLIKSTRYNIPSCTYKTPDTNFHWMAAAIVLPFLQYTLTLQSIELDISVIF